MDVIDIQSLEHEDTKNVRLDEIDQRQYNYFPTVISERWQQEVCDTVFQSTNQDADVSEKTRRKSIPPNIGPGCIMHGFIKRQGLRVMDAAWQTRYAYLFPEQLELYHETISGKPEVNVCGLPKQI